MTTEDENNWDYFSIMAVQHSCASIALSVLISIESPEFKTIEVTDGIPALVASAGFIADIVRVPALWPLGT